MLMLCQYCANVPPFSDMPSFQVNAKWAAISEVVPGLYVSGVSSLNPATLTRHRITCVVNATNEVPNLNVPGVERIKLWVADEDDVPLHNHFDLVADHVNMTIESGGRALVHCVAGVSRSATLVLAYLLKYHARSLREAYHVMSSRRAMVRPNLGFWRQLIAYEKQLKGKVSVRLIETNSQLLPDVYLPIIVPEAGTRLKTGCTSETSGCLSDTSDTIENSCGGQLTGRERICSGPKFVPTLAPLVESVDP